MFPPHSLYLCCHFCLERPFSRSAWQTPTQPLTLHLNMTSLERPSPLPGRWKDNLLSHPLRVTLSFSFKALSVRCSCVFTCGALGSCLSPPPDCKRRKGCRVDCVLCIPALSPEWAPRNTCCEGARPAAEAVFPHLSSRWHPRAELLRFSGCQVPGQLPPTSRGPRLEIQRTSAGARLLSHSPCPTEPSALLLLL